MAKNGLYGMAFSSPVSNDGMMNEYRTNRRWKREEDDYLTRMGVMEVIKKDPNAAKGYLAQQDPEMLTLRMDPFVTGTNWGQYGFTPDYEEEGLRIGNLSIDTDLDTTDWAQTLGHELGHAGSRNNQPEEDAVRTFTSGEEEDRQRFYDYILNSPNTMVHQDAKRYLKRTYGPAYEQMAQAYRDEIEGKEAAAPIPKPKPRPAQQKSAEAPPPKKKKKKTLMDYLK